MSTESTQFDSVSVNFVKNKFKEFYKNNILPTNSIIDIDKREFGVGDFGKKISSRHLSFKSYSDLNSYLVSVVPFYISYSVGYFKYPDKRPMESKEWFGGDIVYEFDSDDFDLPCKNEHDTWICKNENCKKTGYGHVNLCPECGGSVESIEWTCEVCLNKAKQELIRLIDVLVNDFSFDPNYFMISFSGSKGYHLRIFDPKIIPLSKYSRELLMNYILGNDISLEKLGFVLENKKWHTPSIKSSKGWSKKILDFIYDTLKNSNEHDLKEILNISSQKARLIIKNKEIILNKLNNNNLLWDGFKGQDKFWDDFLNIAINNIRLKIDPSVAQDIYKIVRVPNTLHGGTGFLAKSFNNIDELNKFDPFVDPIVFGDNKINLKIIKPVPKLYLFKKRFGPYNVGDIVEVEEYLGIYLILKGVGIIE